MNNFSYSNCFAVIVAGGKGLRMGGDIPKQFQEIGQLPVLMHTIRRFHELSQDINIILVLPESQISFWEKLKLKYQFILPHKTVNGGNSRFQSVYNGLLSIPTEKITEGLVAIHDGVRPFVTPAIIHRAFEQAQEMGTSVVTVPLKDSIRKVIAGGNKSLDRKDYYLVQTPQTFQLPLILKAFDVEEQPFFTDDASVAEYAGHNIHLTNGDYRNIKITTPEDMEVAEVFVKKLEK